MTGFFETLNTSLGGSNKEPSNGGFFETIAEKEPEISKEANPYLDVAKQLGLGLAERLTFPLDIIKNISHAISIGDLNDEDPEVQKQASESVQKIFDYFPTQELAEKFISEQTGINLNQETTAGEHVRSISRLFSLGKGSILKSGAKNILKRLGGAVLGAE